MPLNPAAARLTATAIALALVVVCATAAAAHAATDLRYRVWTMENGLPQSTVRDIAQTPDGYLWFATLGGLVRFDGVRMVVYSRSDVPVMPTNRITCLFVDRHGTLWAGTEDAGILEKTGETFRVHRRAAGLPGEEIAHLAEDEAGNLWADTNSGYVIHQAGRWTTPEVIRPLPTAWRGARPSYPATAAERLRRQRWPSWTIRSEGRTWVLDGGVLHVRENDGWRTIPTPVPAVALPNVHRLFEDAEGTIWIGSDTGLVQGVPTPVRGILPEAFPGLQPNISTLTEDSSGRVWVGTAGGPFVIDRGTPEDPSLLPWWPKVWIITIEAEPDGSLLAGSNSGLYRIWPDRGSEKIADVPPVSDVLRDRRGTLWVGTVRGLYRQTPGGWSRITGLPAEDVRALLVSRDGALWVGIYGGLARVDGDRVQAWTTADGLSGDRIRALHEDADGALWLGTYDTGLMRYRDGRFAAIRKRHGLFDDGVFAILDDGGGWFYMCSNRGIHAVAKANLDAVASGAARTLTYRAWRQADGMPSSECNGGRQPSGFRARDGTLWFPTQRGIAVLDPAAAQLNTTPPPVVIEEIKTGQRVLPSGSAVTLGATERRLEVRYTANTFIRPDLARFRHRLEGLDGDWVETGDVRVLQYPQIPPGRYVLRIAAANSDGVWNMNGRSIEVIVTPAVYQRWWFHAGMAGSAAGLVIMFLRRRELALKRAHAAQQAFSLQLIAAQEAERSRFAGELHDGLGQRLVIIKNLAQLARSENDGVADGRLEEITGEASHAIAEVREIARDLRPYHLDRLGLTKALAALVRTADDSSPTAFVADMESIDDVIPKEAAIHLYRAVQECLSNVLKHASATETQVTVRRTADRITIVIRDNGVGFTVGALGHAGGGFGLTGIAERVRAVGGRVDIKSAPSEGTTVTLTFAPKLRHVE
jgi:signal transduction histidine kinase/ligand-binding sensor domain-containing protein